MLRTLPVLLFCVLTACGPGGGSGAGSANGGPVVTPRPRPIVPTPFAGAPKSFDGVWTGNGRAFTDKWEQTDLSFRIYIGRTPAAADVNYDIRESDGTRFSLGSFTGHYVVGNVIFASETRKPVGEIGEAGFHFTRPGDGRFEVVGLEDGRVRASGYLEYGPTKIHFEAILSSTTLD